MNSSPFDHKTAWLAVQEMFPILKKPPETSVPNTTNYEETCNMIKTLHLTEHIQYLVITKIEEKLRKEIVPTFWDFFKKNVGPQGWGFQQFSKAVEYLFGHFNELETIGKHLEVLRNNNNFCTPIYNNDNMENTMILILKSSLFSQLPFEHKRIIFGFFEISIKRKDPQDTSVPKGSCVVCKKIETEHCMCDDLFRDTNK